MIKKACTTFFEPAHFDDDVGDDKKFSKMTIFGNVVSMLVLLLEDLPNLIALRSVIPCAGKFCGKHLLRQFKTTLGRASQISSLVASTVNVLWIFIVYSSQMFVTKGPSCFRRHCCCHIGALILCLVYINISLDCLTIKDITKIYTSKLTFFRRDGYRNRCHK